MGRDNQGNQQDRDRRSIVKKGTVTITKRQGQKIERPCDVYPEKGYVQVWMKDTDDVKHILSSYFNIEVNVK